MKQGFQALVRNERTRASYHPRAVSAWDPNPVASHEAHEAFCRFMDLTENPDRLARKEPLSVLKFSQLPWDVRTFVHFCRKDVAYQIAEDKKLQAGISINGFGAYAYPLENSEYDYAYSTDLMKSQYHAAVWFKASRFPEVETFGEVVWRRDVRIHVIQITAAATACEKLTENGFFEGEES